MQFYKSIIASDNLHSVPHSVPLCHQIYEVGCMNTAHGLERSAVSWLVCKSYQVVWTVNWTVKRTFNSATKVTILGLRGQLILPNNDDHSPFSCSLLAISAQQRAGSYATGVCISTTGTDGIVASVSGKENLKSYLWNCSFYMSKCSRLPKGALFLLLELLEYDGLANFRRDIARTQCPTKLGF